MANSKTTVTAQDVIKKFMLSLDKTTDSITSALNQAVKVASGGYFQNLSAAVDQMVADCQTVNDATKFLKNYCGIILGNSDTGAITGSDAGGSTTKTKNSIVPESGALHNFTGSSFTTNGLTVQLANITNSYVVSNLSFNKLDSKQKYIWQALETWWAKGALNLIAESYGNNFGFDSSSSATIKKIYVGFTNSSTGSLATTLTWPGSSGNVEKMALLINMKKFDSLIIGNADGKSTNEKIFYLDRTLAHELTHAVTAANIKNGWDLPLFLKEGVAELTHGIDDERTSLIKSLAGNSSSLAGALSLTDNSVTTRAYAGGYMFLRYLAKQGSENYGTVNNSPTAKLYRTKGISVSSVDLSIGSAFADDVFDLTAYPAIKNVNAKSFGGGIKIIGNSNNNSIISGSGNDVLSGGAGNDTLTASTGSDILTGGAGNDSLDGGTGNDSLHGGAGNDSLFGNTGNDTLTGGAGKDIFFYASGNDVIMDYAAGNDTIRILKGTISSASGNGDDVIFKIGTGSLTVRNGADKKLKLIDSAGKNFSTVVSASTIQTVTDSTPSPLKIGSAVKSVNASTRTTTLQLLANTLANSILGGSGDDSINGLDGNDTLNGGSGNDILIGGAGNDSLYGADDNDTLNGGSSNDVLIGGAGNDSLYGYTGDDTLNGGAGNDSLRGGAGNDSLNGGKGNDSLWGNAGNDKFFYKSGDGKDVIFGFENNDLLQITGTFSASYNSSKKEVAFKVGSGSVTLKDFGSTTLFHVNDTTYQLSGSKLTKK